MKGRFFWCATGCRRPPDKHQKMEVAVPADVRVAAISIILDAEHGVALIGGYDWGKYLWYRMGK
jgi:hypothetical protein